jgi:hypothetical protein
VSVDPVLLFSSAKELAWVSFGGFERLPPVSAHVFAGPIDVKCQHRHCRMERRRLAPLAALCGPLQRPRYLDWIVALKDVCLKIKSIAMPCHFRRPCRGGINACPGIDLVAISDPGLQFVAAR